MPQITINLPNEAEAEWLLGLLRRLQVSYHVEDDQAKRKRAKEIIMQGADTLDVEEMLQYVKETRQDRELPFRDE